MVEPTLRASEISVGTLGYIGRTFQLNTLHWELQDLTTAEVAAASDVISCTSKEVAAARDVLACYKAVQVAAGADTADAGGVLALGEAATAVTSVEAVGTVKSKRSRYRKPWSNKRRKSGRRRAADIYQ